MPYSLFTLFFIVLFALVLGSFFTMLVTRVPLFKEESFWAKTRQLAWPCSHCDDCQKPLTTGMLVPLFGFLWHKGRCGFCDKPIGMWVLWLELLTVALAVYLWWFYLDQAGWAKTLWIFVFFSSLLVLSFIDGREGILPDVITLPLVWLGLLLNVSDMFAALPDAVLGAAFGYGSLWLVYQLYYLLTKKEGLGYGDFKLFAAIGAWFGWQALPIVLMVASMLALVFVVIEALRANPISSVAFGPFIAGATFLVWAFSLTSWWWTVWS